MKLLRFNLSTSYTDASRFCFFVVESFDTIEDKRILNWNHEKQKQKLYSNRVNYLSTYLILYKSIALDSTDFY